MRSTVVVDVVVVLFVVVVVNVVVFSCCWWLVLFWLLFNFIVGKTTGTVKGVRVLRDLHLARMWMCILWAHHFMMAAWNRTALVLLLWLPFQYFWSCFSCCTYHMSRPFTAPWIAVFPAPGGKSSRRSWNLCFKEIPFLVWFLILI